MNLGIKQIPHHPSANDEPVGHFGPLHAVRWYARWQRLRSDRIELQQLLEVVWNYHPWLSHLALNIVPRWPADALPKPLLKDFMLCPLS